MPNILAIKIWDKNVADYYKENLTRITLMSIKYLVSVELHF